MIDSGVVLRWTLVVVTAAVFQIGLAPDFPVVGIVPDLLLAVAMAAGVAAGPRRGAIIGFWCGLLFDLMRPGPLGLSALAYAVCAYGVGSLLVSVITVRRVLGALVVFGGSFVALLIFGAGNELLGGHALTVGHPWTIMFVVSVCAGVLSLAAVPLARWAEGAGAIDSREGVLGSVDV